MVKPNWRRAAAVVVALTAAQKAQPAKAESIRSLLSEWMDPDTGLEKTVATGKKLEAAVADRVNSWFSQAAAVVTAAPISDDLKNDAIEEIEQVVRPSPTPYPYGPEPDEPKEPGRWVNERGIPPGYVPSIGDVYARLDKKLPSATRGEVRDYSMWKYAGLNKDGKHIVYDAADSKKEITVSDADLRSNYQLFERGDWRKETLGGRKTRRGKKRRTVKRRAKSLRRRRQ